jgi:hypothetical protein
LCALSCGLVLAITAGAGRLQAHPLGNFTINHLARLQPEAGQLRVHYVLDIAEIPTFQIMHGAAALDPAGDARLAKRGGVLVAVLGVVVASWLVCAAVYRMRRYDRLDLEHAASAR